uniref:Uncharacterized protein n=1 Tax=Mola mola TaxID=94237 RepID=A0A3Q3VYD3_MOLML
MPEKSCTVQAFDPVSKTLSSIGSDFFHSAALGRMIGNQEEDEFIAVRVQDPRIQNEGSWNSYVDYKIFLHDFCSCSAIHQ